jgi:N-acetylglucosaminyldiphosphoundecaprenol N-acetyl-beta-D-mannosaminyltransferase
MIDRGKRDVLGVGVNVIDYESAVAKIIDAGRCKKPLGVSALAVHGVMTGALDPEHKFRLNRLHLITPDGQPVRWALRFLHGERLPDRVYGPNLTLMTCARAADEGLSVYLYGSRPAVLDAWLANLRRQLPALKIAGAEPSRFRNLDAEEDQELNERISAAGADIVLVGLGCPRQEVFVYEHADALSRPVLAVGAAFDFHAGLLRQAPNWMQDRGLEWLFRLCAEPRRLWRRYLYLNPLFLLLICRQKLGFLPRQTDQTPPPRPIRYG